MSVGDGVHLSKIEGESACSGHVQILSDELIPGIPSLDLVSLSGTSIP